MFTKALRTTPHFLRSSLRGHPRYNNIWQTSDRWKEVDMVAALLLKARKDTSTVSLSELENILNSQEPAKLDEDTAYAIQASQIEQMVAEDVNSHVGYKCGATSQASQERLGTSSPFYGPLWNTGY